MLGRLEYLTQQAGFQVEKGLDFASAKTVDYFQNWDYDKSVRYFRDVSVLSASPSILYCNSNECANVRMH